MKNVILDIEANNLINGLLDFTSRPFKLKDTARLWCIALRNYDDLDDVIFLKLEECTKENLKEALKNVESIIFHNGVNYDAPVLKLFGVLDYTIGYPGQSSTLFGKPVKIVDTLIWSKLLNPDRFGGHSLDAWGKRTNNLKQPFREICIEKGYIEKSASKGAEFQEYYPETGIYCIQDTSTTASTLEILNSERVEWGTGWDKAYDVELKLVDLTLKQALFGFHFDMDLAKDCVEELNQTLVNLADKVDPLLPEKMLNKGEQKLYTPPRVQFKQNGDMSAHMLNFIKRLDAKVLEEDNQSYLLYDNNKFLLPYTDCVKTSIKSGIDDLDNLKAYLLDLGWDPLEWKERDLTKDSKKQKLEGDKLYKTIERYVDNTLNGPYKKYRLDILGIEDETDLLTILESKIGGFGIKVPVSPCIRVGTEKKLCPNLEVLGKKAEFAGDVTQYLTYKHRKNSISGGKEDEDGEPLTGYISLVREDGRISTPADTIGAATYRYRHKEVCNVPRASSLYGDKMRAMFGAGEGYRQFGFDFASLEARINGHYVMNYPFGPELAEALVAQKPNDIHCLDVNTEILTYTGWSTYKDISKKTMLAQWDQDNNVSFLQPSDIIINNYKGKMISVKDLNIDMLLSPKHRVVLFNEDKDHYHTVLAKDLSGYLSENPNCFIPSSGNLDKDFDKDDLLIELTRKYSKDHVEYESFIEKSFGYVVQSFDKDLIDIIQADFLLADCVLTVYTKNKNNKTIYQTLIPKTLNTKKGHYLSSNVVITEVDYSDDIWCVTVPSSYIICRRNSKVFVTGNSVNARKLGIDRDSAKSFSYAVMYGAQPAKVAKMLGISVKEAEKLFKAYWEAVPALKSLKDKLEAYWESKGKEFILGIDGRKLLARSKHSLINLLFQSAGAIAAKYAIVYTCQRLEELELLGNPLEDDEFAEKVYMMIMYHKQYCGFVE